MVGLKKKTKKGIKGRKEGGQEGRGKELKKEEN